MPHNDRPRARIHTESAYDVKRGDVVKLNPFFDKRAEYRKSDGTGDYIMFNDSKEFAGEANVTHIREDTWIDIDINGYLYARNMLLVKGVDYT